MYTIFNTVKPKLDMTQHFVFNHILSRRETLKYALATPLLFSPLITNAGRLTWIRQDLGIIYVLYSN